MALYDIVAGWSNFPANEQVTDFCTVEAGELLAKNFTIFDSQPSNTAVIVMLGPCWFRRSC